MQENVIRQMALTGLDFSRVYLINLILLGSLGHDSLIPGIL